MTTVCLGGTNSVWTISLLSKKQISSDLVFDLLIRSFFGRGEFAVCHSLLCLLVSGSCLEIHDSSPVITRLKKSFKYHVFAPVGRFQLELIYLYFPLSFHLIVGCFCPVIQDRNNLLLDGRTVKNKGKLILTKEFLLIGDSVKKVKTC